MTKRDFHGIKIKEDIIFISKNKNMIKEVAKLFNDIKSDKISKIIQAVLSYSDMGLSGACLKNGTLTKREIYDNRKYFKLSINMLSIYIDINKQCAEDVEKTVFKYIDSTICKKRKSGVCYEN